MRIFVQKIIEAYQKFFSPWLGAWLGGECRFYPSCSEYFRQAVEKYSLRRGIFLGVRRLCKCHPYHPGGLDHP